MQMAWMLDLEVMHGNSMTFYPQMIAVLLLGTPEVKKFPEGLGALAIQPSFLNSLDGSRISLHDCGGRRVA